MHKGLVTFPKHIKLLFKLQSFYIYKLTYLGILNYERIYVEPAMAGVITIKNTPFNNKDL